MSDKPFFHSSFNNWPIDVLFEPNGGNFRNGMDIENMKIENIKSLFYDELRDTLYSHREEIISVLMAAKSTIRTIEIMGHQCPELKKAISAFEAKNEKLD